MFRVRVEVEGHGLLANFYFAVLEATSAFVNMQDGTGSVWELPNAKRIDEIVLEEGLEDVAAAMGLKVRRAGA